MALRCSDDDTTMASNQSAHDAEHEQQAALRRVLCQQGFVAKPTAYAPYGRQDEHPLRDAHVQLQARLQALRDVRSRLRFVASTASTSSSVRGLRSRVHGSMSDMDVAMTAPSSPSSSLAARHDSMTITTRVALSSQSTTDVWVQRGGIVALDGLETLFLGFLTTHELVTAGAVCQSWYALARRDAFWEPLLHTPVEKYPLRAFLGFHETASVPAIQVYIIYRKIRAQLQTLHAKDDETPRQSPDALRFEELILRFRRAGNHENNDQNNNEQDRHHDAVEDEMAMLAQVHEDLPPPVEMPRRAAAPARRLMRDGWGATTTAARAMAPNLHLRSVHLVYPADEAHEGAALEDRYAAVEDLGLVHEAALGHPLEHERQEERLQLVHDRHPMFEEEPDSDEEGQVDVEMLAPDGVALDQPQATTTAGAPAASILTACRRIRLQTWLTRQRTVSRDAFRSFARQLLLALATLEMSQIAHSDVCVGNILVLDRGATKSVLPHASSTTAENNQQPAAGGEATAPFPLFQLYCRSSVNTWAASRSSPIPATLRDPLAHPPPMRGGHAEALAHRMRQRHHRMMAVFGMPAPRDIDDEEEVMLRHVFAPRALPRAGLAGEVVQPLAPAAPAAPLAPAAPAAPVPPPLPFFHIPTHAPSSANYASMVRSYIRILREVWTHGRVASTNERNLPFLSLIYLRPALVKSVSFRSFIEYAEYLMSRNEATPSKLLHHVFLQDDTSSSPRSAKRTTVSPSRFIIGRSPLNPISCANAEAYRTQAITWHTRYLAARQAQQLPRNAASATTLGSFGSLQCIPSTLYGPAFFHDALIESRLPFQRFLSVAAPRTATSSWVRTLALSQRYTLQKLDLSRVELPLSILLRELQHLQRLSHLRLPREILRDENMEQFVAALWCSGLLPSLEVMDDTVKKALDRMEFGYATQLNIMASLLEPNSKKPPAEPTLHHTFSSPF